MTAFDTPQVRVMIVDDHDGFRAALATALATRPWIELTRDAASGEQALELVAGECPDVVLMDYSLPGLNGVDTTRRLAGVSDAKVIGVSMHDAPAYARSMRRAGGKAWVVKGGGFEELVAVIRRVAAGEDAWDDA